MHTTRIKISTVGGKRTYQEEDVLSSQPAGEPNIQKSPPSRDSRSAGIPEPGRRQYIGGTGAKPEAPAIPEPGRRQYIGGTGAKPEAPAIPEPGRRQYIDGTGAKPENTGLPHGHSALLNLEEEHEAVSPYATQRKSYQTRETAYRNTGIYNPLQKLKKYISGGHYVIQEQIAKGAESVLYSARCNGKTYCVKSIRNFIHRIFGDLKTRNDSPKLTNVKYSTKCRHIRNEYAISQMLDPSKYNDSIIQIYGLRKVRFLIFEVGYDLIMDYIEGTDLTDRNRLNALSIEEKVDIIIQCTQALNHFHKHHLIHLDIKPSNFMLTPDLRVVMIDFGVSVSSGMKSRSVTGTSGYLSPEQICRQPLNTDTDIFALGMTFAVIFGSSPLLQDIDTIKKKEYRKEVEDNLKNAAVPAIESIPDLVAYPALSEVIRKCTILKREQRIGSCRQLLLNIRAACKEDGIRLLKPERLENLLNQ